MSRPGHQEAFTALENYVLAAPVLGCLNLAMEFILETDTSLKGLGAVLSKQGIMVSS